MADRMLDTENEKLEWHSYQQEARYCIRPFKPVIYL